MELFKLQASYVNQKMKTQGSLKVTQTCLGSLKVTQICLIIYKQNYGYQNRAKSINLGTPLLIASFYPIRSLLPKFLSPLNRISKLFSTSPSSQFRISIPPPPGNNLSCIRYTELRSPLEGVFASDHFESGLEQNELEKVHMQNN